MKNFIFKLFTRRIEVKLSKTDDENKRLKFLVDQLMKEMKQQELYEFDNECSYIMIFEHQNSIVLYGKDKKEVRFIKEEDKPCMK